MKRIALIIIISSFMLSTFFLGNSFSATKLNLGFKVGFDISAHWSTEEKSDQYSVESHSKNGFLFGAIARFKISNFFKLQSEILYVQKGSEQDVTIPSVPIGTIKVLYDLQYVEIPLVLKSYPLKGKGAIQPYFSIGPYYAFLLKSTYKLSNIMIGNVEEDMEDLKKNDMGIIFGSGLEFKKKKIEFSINYRYSMGFVDLNLPTGPDFPIIELRNNNHMVTYNIMF